MINNATQLKAKVRNVEKLINDIYDENEYLI